MTRWANSPAYLTIAADYRNRILNGTLAGGAKLPSESALMREYEVSRIVAKMAINVLRNEGLIVSHKGKGSFVKEIRRIVRDSHGRYSRRRASQAPPFASDVTASGQYSDWEHKSQEISAPPDVAHRLAIEPGAAVICTEYRFLARSEPGCEGRTRAGPARTEPVQLSTSWEPLSLTRDTPITDPEAGPVVGVIARMDSIGVHVDTVSERVTARAALPYEIDALDLPQHGSYVLLIQRTHYAGSRPVETCDIVFPGDRYELTYRIPVE